MADISDVIKKSMMAGIGVIAFTAEKAQEFVNEMVERGEMSREQGMKMTKELVKKGEEARAQLQDIIGSEIKDALDKAHIPTKEDLKKIEEKIDKVIAMLSQQGTE